MKLYMCFVILFVCSCGGVVEEPTEAIVTPPIPTADGGPERYCGDYICDEDLGEDYWNCLDCVDLMTGGPTNGYCGDGICYKETMLSCWKDCRPKAYNPDPEFGPGPGPFPPGPLPGPEPGPGPLPPGPGPDPGPDPGF